MSYDRPVEIQVSNTFTISLSVARAAARRNVRTYLRMIGPFFAQADPSKKFTEDDENGWKPDGPRGVWWMEMIRAMGSIPNLPLVVLRAAIPYGPGLISSEGQSRPL